MRGALRLVLLLAALHPLRAAPPSPPAASADPSELDLSRRGLTRLPKSLFRREALERLNLEDNALASLPKEIARLARLRSLNLSRNRLSALPPEISMLSSLEYLGLAGNPIASLPESLGRLQSLSILDLRDTGLARVPAHAEPLLRRGAAALVSSSTFRAYADEPFAGLEARHIQRETRFSYSVSLGLPAVRARRREDLFFPPDRDIVVFDPSLNYAAMNGVVPCSAGERHPGRAEVASLPEPDLRAFLAKSCPREVFAHGAAGPERIRLKELRAERLDCCGAPCARVTAPRGTRPGRPLFYSTMRGARGKGAFTRLLRTLDAELPPWLKLAQLPIPAGFTRARVEYSRYPSPAREAFLAYVRAEGILLSELSDDPVTATWGAWQAVFWVERSGARLLTPPLPAAQRAFGTSLEPVGLYDVNGDGAPDLVLGEPVSMVLERYADGFRSWGFPSPRAGSCPRAP